MAGIVLIYQRSMDITTTTATAIIPIIKYTRARYRSQEHRER